MFVRASLYKRREENQLDATERFIALIICSTCFGHLYANHQDLEAIIVLLPHMVCNAARMKRYNNPLMPNDPFRGRTAPLTSKRFILYIYSTNIGTEYFKHGVYSPFFLFKMQFVS